MKRLAIQLFRDEAGVVVTPEIIIITTVGLLSLIAGWNAVSNALASELGDVANAVASLDQSYSYRGISAGVHATCSGSGYADSSQSFSVDAIDVNVVGRGADGEVTINLSDVELNPTQAIQSAGSEEVAIFDVERIDAEGEVINNLDAIQNVQNQINAIQKLVDDSKETVVQSTDCEEELKTLLGEIQRLCRKAEQLKAAREKNK